jgi:hypothetical protein
VVWRHFAKVNLAGSIPAGRSSFTCCPRLSMTVSFLPSRCAVVDTNGRSALIRGNFPLTGDDQHFALHEIIEKTKIDLLSRKLIVMTIIDNVGERYLFEPEMRAFGVDPNRFPQSYWPPYLHADYDSKTMYGNEVSTEGFHVPATIVWWPFEGLPSGEDPAVYLGAPGWSYGGFVDYASELLTTMRDTVIYMHCLLGADRTGAAHIGYLMRRHGMSLELASATANASTSAGAPNADYQRLVTAYAETL